MFIYKNSIDDEERFLSSIYKSLYKKTSNMDIEKEIQRITSNPNMYHHNNLMLLHWYERRTGKNVINHNVLSGLNPSNRYISKRNLDDEIIDRKNNFMQSGKYDGFTVYYEYYHTFFPELEKLSFKDFSGRFFYDYLLELFPALHEIDYKSQKKFFRYKKGSNSDYSESYYSLAYKPNNLPSFYPSFQGERHAFSPTTLLTTEKHEVANLVRVEKGLPKIGEGWISETQLFYSIKSAFENFKVIQHASPDWLGRQHLDIYLPEFKIAVEYQGVQHSKPVAFFGGEEAFIKNQERDKRKKGLCEKHDCHLIYAYPENEHSEIIDKVKKIINAVPNTRKNIQISI